MSHLSHFKQIGGDVPKRTITSVKIEGDDKSYFLIDIEDNRQGEKSLKKDGVGEAGVGYQEILNILKRINPEKMKLTDNYEITNRRDGTIFYGTGQYVDTLNVIHVKDSSPEKIPILATTEDRLKLEVEMYRNRWVGLIGTILIVLGIFWPYLWQGVMCLIEH
jgi:hypothetical protein